MWPLLNELFGKKKQTFIQRSSPAIAQLMDELYSYYLNLEKKTELLRKLKDLIVTVKSQIYDFQTKQDVIPAPATITQLQQQVEDHLDELIKELEKIKALSVQEKVLLTEFSEYSHDIIPLIEAEFQKEQELKENTWWAKYKETLLNLKQMLLNQEDKKYGLFHLLAAQLDLLNDVTRARIEVTIELAQIAKQNSGALPFESLKATLRILEMEILRFGKYCEQEAELLGAPQVLRTNLKKDLDTLRTLGLVYSEKSLTPYNVRIVAGKIDKDRFGFKGIGIIKEDSVEIRFVKGARERHAEVVQMLFEGLPGMKLSSDQAIRAYLASLPSEKLARIAGYEAQLRFDENGELMLININYSSTILDIQIQRKLGQIQASGQLFEISEKDFERLNYALLFSIDKRLVDKKAFEMTIEKRGNKIAVIDQRILPFKPK